MSAYLFTAGVSQTRVRPESDPYGATRPPTWDTCVHAILHGAELVEARKVFETWCQPPPSDQHPIETEIKRVVSARFADELLTESGNRPLDWKEISQRATETVLQTEVEDFEQGYWVDVNQAVPPERISLSLESLKSELPEDIRAGLNWSAEKQSLFVVSHLSPPPAPPDLDEGLESKETSSHQDGEEQMVSELDQTIAGLPEMREKEGAGLVEARNSVVAAWLWRKFAAQTPSASNEILIEPVSNLFSVEEMQG